MGVAHLIVYPDEPFRHFQRFSRFAVLITCRSSAYRHGLNPTLSAQPEVLIPRSVYLPESFHQQSLNLFPAAGGWLFSVLSQIPIRIILADLAQLSRPFVFREAIGRAPPVDPSPRPPDAWVGQLIAELRLEIPNWIRADTLILFVTGIIRRRNPA